MDKVKIVFTLITVGVFFALETFGIIHVYIVSLWPLLFFVFGLAFHVYYFVQGAPKNFAFLLFPAGMMLSLGALVMNDGDQYFAWSIYLLGIAFGLFEWQLFGEEDFTVPITLMTSFSLVVMILNGISYYYLCPFLLLASFCYILNDRRKKVFVKSGSV